MMSIEEARRYVGSPLRMAWIGSDGLELHDMLFVYSVDFVPLDGPCLITDRGEIRLGRVVAFEPIVSQRIS